MFRSLQKRWTSPLTQGIFAAAVLHILGLAALAGMHLPSIAAKTTFLLFQGSGARESVQLTLHKSAPSTPLRHLNLEEEEINITPEWVETAGQRLINHPASELDTSDWIDALNLPPLPKEREPIAEIDRDSLSTLFDSFVEREPVVPEEESDQSLEEVAESVNSTRGEITRQPDLSNNRKPSYPDQAFRMRWEGTVTLRLFIDVQGDVTKVEIVESSGYPILDEAAVNACRSWRGSPAMQKSSSRFSWLERGDASLREADIPVATTVIQPIRFQIP